MSAAIETIDLSKRFPRSTGYKELLMPWKRSFGMALRQVNLRVEPGEVFGLLGPNGAGKTTLMKTLATLILPDDGRALVYGYDVARHSREVRGLVSYVVSEERSFFWRLTGRQNLRFFAELNEVPRREVAGRVGNLLSLVGLEHAADERVMRYSTGMKHRLAIARGLMSDSSLLLLDEPTRSLDPLSARQIWTLVKEELVGRFGKTVVIATHNMEEAAFLCDRVAFMSLGEVKACDTVATLQGALSRPVSCSVLVCDFSPQVLHQLTAIQGVQVINAAPPNGHREHSLELTLEEPMVQVPAVVEQLVSAGCKVLQVAQKPRSLTDVIADLTAEGNGECSQSY